MRSRKVVLMIMAIALIMAMAQVAFTMDYFDLWSDHWTRGIVGTTSQAWEFERTQGPLPTRNGNFYGDPHLTFTGAHYPDVVEGPWGQPINTWHIDVDGGTMNIYLPNSPEHNPLKLIYLQVTSDKYTLDNQLPIVDAPGAGVTKITTPGPIVQHPYGTWYTYNWLIEIKPNPVEEWITLVFPASTNIEEVVVDTICTVPEPSSVAALIAGLFSIPLLKYRRRR